MQSNLNSFLRKSVIDCGSTSALSVLPPLLISSITYPIYPANLLLCLESASKKRTSTQANIESPEVPASKRPKLESDANATKEAEKDAVKDSKVKSATAKSNNGEQATP